MALSAPRDYYGIHSVTPYSRTTGLPYGTLRVLSGSSISSSGELVELMGGSYKYSWAAEESKITTEMTLKTKEFPDFLYELFLGKAPTSATTDTTGTVAAITNKYGTSVVNSTTGIASVGIKSGENAELKFGKYVVKAVSSTTVDVYIMSDIDITRGTDKEIQNDAMKITASALTITASTAVEVPDFGVELTGGSGTIGMTTGDTAVFEVKPPSTASMTVKVGATSDTFPEFGSIVMAQKKGNGQMLEIDCFRCKGAGFPHNFEESAFAEAEIKIKLLYDSTENAVYEIRHISPS